MSKINAGQSSSTLIPKYIGSDFDAVLEVADNIEAIKLVAKTIEVPFASEAKAGIARIATQIEVNHKTNDNHIVTPKKLGVYAAPLVHIHDTATPTESGFLSTTDKQKLDGIADNANNYTHPTTDGSLHVPATGTYNNGKLLKAGGTAGSLVWANISKTDVGLFNVDNTSDLNKPISIATQAALDGKSATDHAHSYLPLIGGTLTGALSGTTFTGALNGNASTATSAGKLTTARTISLTGDVTGSVSFDGSTDVTFVTSYKSSGVVAGTYRSVTVNENGYITAGTNPTTLAGYGITDAAASSHVGSTGTAHGVASTSVAGFMSAADKTKLDGITSGATTYVHPTGDGNLHVPITGTNSDGYVLKAGSTAGAISWGQLTATDVGALPSTWVPSFSDVSSKPTTLSGYGITDAQPLDSTLTAMSEVVTAADKLIYFNGVDTATSTTLTSFARTLLDDTSAAAAQSTLGVLASTRAFKTPADIATTANLTATYANGSSGVGATLTNSGTLAALVLDGVTATTNMRVLVKNQTTALQNGIYTVTNIGSASVAWVLTRATDSDVTAELAGAVITVDQGTVNGSGLFTNDWKKTNIVGTTAMGWRGVLDSINYSTYAQPKDTTLTALAGVTTAADKLIYATDPDVFTTTSITPFARTLIDDVDAATMRTTLGIDGLPVLTFIGDTPPANPWNGVTWYCTVDGRTYVYYVDTDSSQWVESSPQSPATTDTLSGTNANGDYTKFADGTLICWASITTSASATKAITYPMAFISTPVCTVTVEATTPCVATTQSPSSTSIGINGWNMSSTRVAVVCKLMAIGRWK